MLPCLDLHPAAPIDLPCFAFSCAGGSGLVGRCSRLLRSFCIRAVCLPDAIWFCRFVWIWPRFSSSLPPLVVLPTPSGAVLHAFVCGLYCFPSAPLIFHFVDYVCCYISSLVAGTDGSWLGFPLCSVVCQDCLFFPPAASVAPLLVLRILGLGSLEGSIVYHGFFSGII